MSRKYNKYRYTLLDDEDYEWAKQQIWFYRPREAKGLFVYRKSHLLHREILKAKKGQIVDHKNRNPFDNRKNNLRFCTIGENKVNSLPTSKSGYKGVRKTSNNRWSANIKKNGIQIWLGTYDSKKEAAKAYNKKAIEFWGEFAWLNPV